MGLEEPNSKNIYIYLHLYREQEKSAKARPSTIQQEH